MGRGRAVLQLSHAERDLSPIEAAAEAARPSLVALEEADYALCTGLRHDEAETPEDDEQRSCARSRSGASPWTAPGTSRDPSRGNAPIYCAGALARRYESSAARSSNAGPMSRFTSRLGVAWGGRGARPSQGPRARDRRRDEDGYRGARRARAWTRSSSPDRSIPARGGAGVAGRSGSCCGACTTSTECRCSPPYPPSGILRPERRVRSLARSIPLDGGDPQDGRERGRDRLRGNARPHDIHRPQDPLWRPDRSRALTLQALTSGVIGMRLPGPGAVDTSRPWASSARSRSATWSTSASRRSNRRRRAAASGCNANAAWARSSSLTARACPSVPRRRDSRLPRLTRARCCAGRERGARSAELRNGRTL